MKIPQFKRDAIMERLAVGEAIETAAAEENVAPRTVKYWLARDNDFRERLETRRQEYLDRLRSLLSVAGPKAAVFLTEVATGAQKASTTERLRAANYLLEHLGRWSASAEVLTFAQRASVALQKALSKLAPEEAGEIRTAFTNELYRAGVPADAVEPLTREGGRSGEVPGGGGDNPDPGSGGD